MIGATKGEFSVCQFFHGGGHEYVRRWVGAQEAVQAAKHYTTGVGARTGITQRVIITDGGDSTVFEWRYGEGVVWPKGEPMSKTPRNWLPGVAP